MMRKKEERKRINNKKKSIVITLPFSFIEIRNSKRVSFDLMTRKGRKEKNKFHR